MLRYPDVAKQMPFDLQKIKKGLLYKQLMFFEMKIKKRTAKPLH